MVKFVDSGMCHGMTSPRVHTRVCVYVTQRQPDVCNYIHRQYGCVCACLQATAAKAKSHPSGSLVPLRLRSSVNINIHRRGFFWKIYLQFKKKTIKIFNDSYCLVSRRTNFERRNEHRVRILILNIQISSGAPLSLRSSRLFLSISVYIFFVVALERRWRHCAVSFSPTGRNLRFWLASAPDVTGT